MGTRSRCSCSRWLYADIQLGIAYTIWAGVGTALIVLIGWLALGQKIDAAAIVGVLMIIGGVVVINAFSAIDT